MRLKSGTLDGVPYAARRCVRVKSEEVPKGAAGLWRAHCSRKAQLSNHQRWKARPPSICHSDETSGFSLAPRHCIIFNDFASNHICQAETTDTDALAQHGDTDCAGPAGHARTAKTDAWLRP